jgi:ribonuclease HI
MYMFRYIYIYTHTYIHTYRKRKGNQSHVFDNEVELKDWPHPADAVKITVVKDYTETTVQAYTDGSKYEQGVGSGVAVFIGQEMAAQIKLKLDSRCSNNQAEQLAIIKALEAIESIHTADINTRTATIFTDSKITLDSLQNASNHAYLIEEIRKRVAILENSKWKIEFSWVKAHVGIYGNEMADRLAKEAARSKDTNIAFDRIPKSTLYYEAEEEAKQQWQSEWEKCPKAALTKQYFPSVQDRLNTKISMTASIAAMVTGHGKTRAYLHRFKILEQATCVCKDGDQTTDHLLYHCTLLQTQREALKQTVLKTGNWPASKHELITKHRVSFINFIQSIDFEIL